MDAGLKISIELELLLRPTRRSKDNFEGPENFAKFIVVHRNSDRSPKLRVHNNVDGIYEGLNVKTKWSLTDDLFLEPDEHDPCK